MKKLLKNFTGIGEVKGFKFSQILKTDKGYIYLVNTGSTIYYEVFRHKTNTRFNCISYPKSSSFGIWAWTFDKYDKALDKLNQISINKN